MFFLKSGGQKYVDRGDPSANDFISSYFTKDNTWRDLDLSDIIPLGTSLVLLRVRVMTDNKAAAFELRKNGNTNTYNKSLCSPGAALVSIEYDCHVSVDADRKCEYKATVHDWMVLNLSIRGWFK